MTKAQRAPAGIRVNGEDRALPEGGLRALLLDLDIDPSARGLAVAINGAVLRRADWDSAGLKDGDTLEIVKPFSGG